MGFRRTVIIVVASFLFIANSVLSVRQEITFFTEENGQGEGLTIRRHINDLSNYTFFLQNSKSFCASGYFASYDGIDYKSTALSLWSWLDRVDGIEASCQNSVGIQTRGGSIRFLGASDTTIPAISFYSGVHYSGEEVHVSSVAEASLPFQPKSFASTGNTTWTFFSEPNFEGDSTCISQPRQGLTSPVWTYSGIVRSVVRGCGEIAIENINVGN